MKFEFADEEIRVSNYPYPPSRVYPSGRLPPAKIMEVDTSSHPPTMLLGSGEFVFVPAVLTDELVEFAQRHEIPVIEDRVDVWHFLLEPFLVAPLTAEHHQATLGMLEECGLDPDAVIELRDEVSEAVGDLNLVYQEERHLGLFDVLDAMRRELTALQFKAFFRRAMRIARKG